MKTELLLRAMPKRAVDWLESLTACLPQTLSARFFVQMGVRFRKPEV
jgi:hypothetical protein